MSEPKGIRRSPRREQQSLWALRLLSLAIAITLWLQFSYSGREQTYLERGFENINVTYKIPNGLILLRSPNVVSVRLRGPENSIRDLTPFQISLSVDVPQERGLQEIVLADEMVERPEGLEIVSILPNRLSLEVDEEIEKDLRVVITQGVSEPSGGARWLQEESSSTPGVIKVVGPRSLLFDRDRIYATIDLQNHLSTFRTQVALDSPHELVQVIGTHIVDVLVVMEGPELLTNGTSGF